MRELLFWRIARYILCMYLSPYNIIHYKELETSQKIENNYTAEIFTGKYHQWISAITWWTHIELHMTQSIYDFSMSMGRNDV